LYLGFCAIGNFNRGKQLVLDYVDNHRQSSWPLPGYIRQIIGDRDANNAIGEFEHGLVFHTAP
jgi:hypothetical protein